MLFCLTGKGLAQHQRLAEGITVEVSEAEVLLHLIDGELIHLSRQRDNSAQVFLGMSLRDAVRERTHNRVTYGTRCDHKSATCIHTPAWYEEQIDQRLAQFVVDDDEWPTVLEARRVDAAREKAQKADLVSQSRWAQDLGFAQWIKVGDGWFVLAKDHKKGDEVTVRTKAGKISVHILGDPVRPHLTWVVFKDGGLLQEIALTPQ